MVNPANKSGERLKIAQAALAQIFEIEFGWLLEPRRDHWAIQRGVNRAAFSSSDLGTSSFSTSPHRTDRPFLHHSDSSPLRKTGCFAAGGSIQSHTDPDSLFAGHFTETVLPGG
jgi:hypothetical protein